MPDNKELATNPTPSAPQGARNNQGTLFPVKDVEVDGVQMGVLSDGTPFLTLRGLARMCGIDHKTLFEFTSNWKEERTKRRGSAINRLLLAQGFTGDALYLRVPIRGQEAHAYVDAVCMAILEYYAFESPKESNKTAVDNFRLLARFSFREYIYNRCGYDPNGYIPVSWQNFQQRVALNATIPVRFFSVFCEMANIVVQMIQSGCPIDDHTVPDISVGIAWAKHWDASGFETAYGKRIMYPHVYPDWFPQSKANPVLAWIYPADALGEFRIWLYDNYIKVHFPKYLTYKTKKGDFLPSQAQLVLQKMEQAAIDTKTAPQLPSPGQA